MAKDRQHITQELLNASPDALIVINDAGDIVYSNERAESLFGYSRAELASANIEDLIPERLRDKHEKHRMDYAKQPYRRSAGHQLGVNLFGLRSNGSEFPAEITLNRLQTNEETLTISSIRDVSHRLFEEKQYKELLEASPDAMVLADNDGKILFVNEQTEALFGYAREQLIGSALETLLPQRFREQHKTHRARFRKSPTRRPMGTGLPLYGRHKDGREIPIEISLSPVHTSQGQIVSSSIRDVTTHIEAAQQLTAARETAEIATATKSRFLAAANHDLRQPLQSLGLYLSVLMRRNQQEELNEIGVKMQRSLDTMAELMDAFLDVSKLESGGITPELAEIRIDDLMRRVVDNNAQQAEEKHLDFEHSSSKAVVHTDPVLLERVVQNFVANAIRYTDEGSVRIECAEQEKSLKISVHDSGIGIPADEVSNIFDEYYQLGNQMRSRSKGLGLGLAIVKHIAELLGHPLGVHSAPGVGSVFSIEVPLSSHHPASGENPKQAQIENVSRQPSILFVDDDATIVDATALLLESANITVATACDAEEAIRLVRGGLHPDVLVTDFHLPGLSGVELISTLRELLPEQTDAIVISGDNITARKHAATLSKCTVLSKPVDTEELIHLIRTCTSSS